MLITLLMTTLYGWQTLDDAKDAVEECVDIYDLAVTIKNRYVRCGVPEIDKIITNKLAKAETAEEAERKVKEEEK